MRHREGRILFEMKNSPNTAGDPPSDPRATKQEESAEHRQQALARAADLIRTGHLNVLSPDELKALRRPRHDD